MSPGPSQKTMAKRVGSTTSERKSRKAGVAAWGEARIDRLMLPGPALLSERRAGFEDWGKKPGASPPPMERPVYRVAVAPMSGPTGGGYRAAGIDLDQLLSTRMVKVTDRRPAPAHYSGAPRDRRTVPSLGTIATAKMRPDRKHVLAVVMKPGVMPAA